MVAVNDEELKSACYALYNEHQNDGSKKIRAILKEQHPDWEISEKRVSKFWNMV